MRRPIQILLLLVTLTYTLPALDLQAPVDAYWKLRGDPPDRRDLTIHFIGSVPTDGKSVSLYYYRYAILGDEDGGPQRERELLLVVIGERLHGWYQITGTDRAFALAGIVGQDVVLPDGLRRTLWPLPKVLSDAVTIDGKEEAQFYYLHLATP